MIPAFDPATGALPPGDHRATLEEIETRFGFTPRRRWLLKGLRSAVRAFWAAGIEEIIIDGSFCTEKPDPGDVDGYWVEPDDGVYDRIDPLVVQRVHPVSFPLSFTCVAAGVDCASTLGARGILAASADAVPARTKLQCFNMTDNLP